MDRAMATRINQESTPFQPAMARWAFRPASGAPLATDEGAIIHISDQGTMTSYLPDGMRAGYSMPRRSPEKYCHRW